VTARRQQRVRAGLGAVTAALLLGACSAPAGTTTTPFTGLPDGPDGPFSPVRVAGVAGCGELTTTSTPGGGSTGATLPCLTGPSEVNVDQLGGRLTVVNLWASWCSICRKEMAVLDAAHQSSDGTVQFVGVDTLDEPGPAAVFLTETSVSYPQLYDQQGDLLEYTRIQGLPVTLLLDEDGQEVARHVGELTSETLQDLLDKA
jgi:thiol-disulfide isomerase/thioredoxin